MDTNLSIHIALEIFIIVATLTCLVKSEKFHYCRNPEIVGPRFVNTEFYNTTVRCTKKCTQICKNINIKGIYDTDEYGRTIGLFCFNKRKEKNGADSISTTLEQSNGVSKYNCTCGHIFPDGTFEACKPKLVYNLDKSQCREKCEQKNVYFYENEVKEWTKVTFCSSVTNPVIVDTAGLCPRPSTGSVNLPPRTPCRCGNYQKANLPPRILGSAFNKRRQLSIVSTRDPFKLPTWGAPDPTVRVSRLNSSNKKINKKHISKNEKGKAPILDQNDMKFQNVNFPPNMKKPHKLPQNINEKHEKVRKPSAENVNKNKPNHKPSDSPPKPHSGNYFKHEKADVNKFENDVNLKIPIDNIMKNPQLKPGHDKIDEGYVKRKMPQPPKVEKLPKIPKDKVIPKPSPVKQTLEKQPAPFAEHKIQKEAPLDMHPNHSPEIEIPLKQTKHPADKKKHNIFSPLKHFFSPNEKSPDKNLENLHEKHGHKKTINENIDVQPQNKNINPKNNSNPEKVNLHADIPKNVDKKQENKHPKKTLNPEKVNTADVPKKLDKKRREGKKKEKVSHLQGYPTKKLDKKREGKKKEKISDLEEVHKRYNSSSSTGSNAHMINPVYTPGDNSQAGGPGDEPFYSSESLESNVIGFVTNGTCYGNDSSVEPDTDSDFEVVRKKGKAKKHR